MDLTLFKLDIDELINEFAEHGSRTLADMKKIWLSRKFTFIYESKPTSNVAFFMQSLFAHSISYMLSTSSLSHRLGGLYCLYCLYETQPFKPPFKIYLSLGELRRLRSLVVEAKEEQITVVPALVKRMLEQNIFLFGSVEVNDNSVNERISEITKLQNARVQVAHEKLLANTPIERYLHMDLDMDIDLKLLRKCSTEYAAVKEHAINASSREMEQHIEMGEMDVLQQQQLGEEQGEFTNKEKERKEGKDQQEIKEQGEDRPPHQKCAHCESMDTKFCYFNNYTVKQPRYFCRTCKRYWTQGGSLRNIPVGGKKRSNKRSLSSSDPLIKLRPPARSFGSPASPLLNQEPNQKNKPLLLPIKPEPSTFIYSSTVVSVVQRVKRVHTVGVSGFICSEGLQLPLQGLPQKQQENGPSQDSPMVEADNSKGQMPSIKQSGVPMEMPSATLKLQLDLNEDGGVKASCSEGLQLPLQGLPQKQQVNSFSQDSPMGEVDNSKGQMPSIKQSGVPMEMPSTTLELQKDLNKDGGMKASVGSYLEPSQ